MPLSPSCVIGTSQWAVMLCGWEGNHTSGVTQKQASCKFSADFAVVGGRESLA